MRNAMTVGVTVRFAEKLLPGGLEWKKVEMRFELRRLKNSKPDKMAKFIFAGYDSPYF